MKIIFTGDFSTQNRLANLDKINIINVDGSDYHFVDYAVVNFESPISTSGRPITKIGPNLKNSVKSIQALKEVGVDMLTLANNHFRDYGECGVDETIKECERQNVAYLGGGNFEKSKKPFLLVRDDIKIGIINICENEFSSSTCHHAGSNGFDYIEVYNTVQRLKKESDFIVVIHHGGVEHFQLPTPRMKKLFRHFIDIGVDLVINHHQHCYSGYERYKERLIFYGLGNFLFDAPWPNVPDSWHYGYMVQVEFSRDLEFRIIPYCQCKTEPVVQLLNVGAFVEKIKELNDIIDDDEKLDREFGNFVLKNKYPLSPMLPYHNHYLRALYHRGYLPDLIPEKNKLEILNWSRCESLHECLVKYLELKLDNV